MTKSFTDFYDKVTFLKAIYIAKYLDKDMPVSIQKGDLHRQVHRQGLARKHPEVGGVLGSETVLELSSAVLKPRSGPTE